MVRALDGRALETYYRSLSFKEDFLEMISLIQGSPPSSNPDRNKCNISVWYSSKKMSGLIRAERCRIELPCLLEFEHDDYVLKKFVQPP